MAINLNIPTAAVNAYTRIYVRIYAQIFGNLPTNCNLWITSVDVLGTITNTGVTLNHNLTTLVGRNNFKADIISYIDGFYGCSLTGTVNYNLTPNLLEIDLIDLNCSIPLTIGGTAINLSSNVITDDPVQIPVNFEI